jgi:hypothetical protein
VSVVLCSIEVVQCKQRHSLLLSASESKVPRPRGQPPPGLLYSYSFLFVMSDLVPNHLYSAFLWAPYYDIQGLVTRALHSLASFIAEPYLETAPPFVRQYTFFFLGCIIYAALTYVTLAVLAAVWPSFAAVGEKRFYVVANLLKSLVLGLQVMSPSWWWYSAQEYACNLAPLGPGVSRVVGAPFGASVLPCNWDVDRGHDAFVKAIAACYIITDVVALGTVPKLPLTTKIHHWATFAFGLWVLAVPIAPQPVLQKLLMYGFFSTLAFPVNLFLGLRCTSAEAAGVALLARFSLALYVVACAFNWGLHILWLVDGALRNSLTLAEYAYACSLYAFVRDDLILMSWLASYDAKGRKGQDGKVE